MGKGNTKPRCRVSRAFTGRYSPGKKRITPNTIPEIEQAVEAWHNGNGKVGITIMRSILDQAIKGELPRIKE